MKKLQHFLRTTQGKVIAGLVAIFVALFAYYFYAVSNGQVKDVEEVVITDTDHVRGALDGKVTLVEFADFQCPACGAYEPLIRKVLADNPTTLKIVFRHFPLTQIHQNALIAAKATEAAGVQGKFWEMHDILFDKQKDWSLGLNARDFLVGYAKTLGLDEVKFSADLNSSTIEKKILAEYQEGAKLGVNGTPSFFINGKKIENPQSPEAFNELIKQATK
ncbi:TPA: disulfide bond formation protein DsbA [Candidatus Nomurabacteria bacterium]|nr:disulfide bond formation protein DsbA [Candidatus Nomurabacteria bacterium]